MTGDRGRSSLDIIVMILLKVSDIIIVLVILRHEYRGIADQPVVLEQNILDIF